MVLYEEGLIHVNQKIDNFIDKKNIYAEAGDTLTINALLMLKRCVGEYLGGETNNCASQWQFCKQLQVQMH